MNETLASVFLSLDTKDSPEAISAPTGSISSISLHESHAKNYTTSSDHSIGEEKKVMKQVKGAFPNGSWAKSSSLLSSSQSDESSAFLNFGYDHQVRDKFEKDFITGYNAHYDARRV